VPPCGKKISSHQSQQWDSVAVVMGEFLVDAQDEEDSG
jgi:hypothetical protein